jgi:hypothetical protein
MTFTKEVHVEVNVELDIEQAVELAGGLAGVGGGVQHPGAAGARQQTPRRRLALGARVVDIVHAVVLHCHLLRREGGNL